MKIAAYLIEKIGSTVSGYFHPSLWLSESHGLLVAQGNHRVDARRAACGNVARGKGHEQQEPGDTSEGEWISGSNSEEKAGHEASEHKGCRSADCYSKQGELGATGQDQAEDIAEVRTERHANAE